MPNITDFLLGTASGQTFPVSGVWVRLQNNVTLATFVSTAATDAVGTFTVLTVPPGQYTVATGPTNTGPFTSTTDTSYNVGADVNTAINPFIGSDPWFDVKNATYGAKGDGVTDDTVAIQAALTAARIAGGGTVYMPPGKYIVSLATRSIRTGTVFAGLITGANVVLMGAGRLATTIQLANTQPGRTANPSTVVAIITHFAANETSAANIDLGIQMRDFALNGNSSNQTDTHNGIYLSVAQYASLRGLLVQDVRGTAVDGSVNETFGCQLVTGSDFWVDDCIALQSSGSNNMANGFTVGPGVTNAHVSRCAAIGIKGAAGSDGFGFNSGTGCANVVFSDCTAIQCGQGFHLENTFGVVSSPTTGPFVFIGCTAGTLAATNSAGHFFTFPYTSGGSLGCTFDGFRIADGVNNVRLVSCIASNNGGSGVALTSTTFGNNKGIEILGGQYTGNATAGVATTAAAESYLKIAGHPRLDGNTVAPYRHTDTATSYIVPGVVASPTVPASGTGLGNPFAFDVDVYITAGTGGCTIAVGGDTGTTTLITIAATVQALVRLVGGQNYAVKLTYTNAPTWIWHGLP